MIHYRLLLRGDPSVSPTIYPAVVLRDEQGLELMALPRCYLEGDLGEMVQNVRGAWPHDRPDREAEAEDGVRAARIARDELLDRGLIG